MFIFLVLAKAGWIQRLRLGEVRHRRPGEAWGAEGGAEIRAGCQHMAFLHDSSPFILHLDTPSHLASSGMTLLEGTRLGRSVADTGA